MILFVSPVHKFEVQNTRFVVLELFFAQLMLENEPRLDILRIDFREHRKHHVACGDRVVASRVYLHVQLSYVHDPVLFKRPGQDRHSILFGSH